LLNCYDVIVETAQGDFEFLVWAENHILMQKYVAAEFRSLGIQTHKIEWTKVKIYSGKILHLD
jgi:hypothetical protein